jgi:hypothetical protein
MAGFARSFLICLDFPERRVVTSIIALLVSTSTSPIAPSGPTFLLKSTKSSSTALATLPSSTVSGSLDRSACSILLARSAGDSMRFLHSHARELHTICASTASAWGRQNVISMAESTHRAPCRAPPHVTPTCAVRRGHVQRWMRLAPRAVRTASRGSDQRAARGPGRR